MRTLIERYDVNGSSIVVKMSEHGELLFEIEERPNEKPQRCWLDVNDVLCLTYEASRRTIGGGIEQVTAALKPFIEAMEADETQADSDEYEVV